MYTRQPCIFPVFPAIGWARFSQLWHGEGWRREQDYGSGAGQQAAGHARACTESGRLMSTINERLRRIPTESKGDSLSAARTSASFDHRWRLAYVGGVHVLLTMAAAAPHLGHLFPLWSVAPFVIMLIGIAVLPLVAGRV